MILTKSKLINKWKKNINKDKNILKKIKFIKFIIRKNNKIISAFLDTEIITRDKKLVYRAAQIEWPSVIIVPILLCKNVRKTLMVEQFRVGAGKKLYEFPAGIIEGKNIKLEAIKEIKEELNITIKKRELKKLYNKPIHMLPSSNSAIAHFYYFKKKVTKSFLNKINNTKSGCANDGEHLKIKVVDFNDVKKINTSSALIGLSLINKKFK